MVVPGFEEGGGVPQVGRFLARAIRSSGRYHADIVSLPMNPRDDGRAARFLLRLSLKPPFVEDGNAEKRVLHGTVKISLDDSQTPELELPYVVHLR